MANGNGAPINKGISLGNILTMLTVIAVAILWWVRVESAVQVNTSEIQHNSEAVTRIEAAQGEQYREIIRRLERIEDRIGG